MGVRLWSEHKPTALHRSWVYAHIMYYALRPRTKRARYSYEKLLAQAWTQTTSWCPDESYRERWHIRAEQWGRNLHLLPNVSTATKKNVKLLVLLIIYSVKTGTLHSGHQIRVHIWINWKHILKSLKDLCDGFSFLEIMKKIVLETATQDFFWFLYLKWSLRTDVNFHYHFK